MSLISKETTVLGKLAGNDVVTESMIKLLCFLEPGFGIGRVCFLSFVSIDIVLKNPYPNYPEVPAPGKTELRLESVRNVASLQTSFGVRLSHSFLPHFSSSVGEKWMRDKRTPKDICGEAMRNAIYYKYYYCCYNIFLICRGGQSQTADGKISEGIISS